MEHRVVLTSQSVTSMKTFNAPGKAVAKLPERSSTTVTEASTPGTGTFEFKWPGRDCWQVFRGDMEVASHCGARTQVLQAGTYTVKPRHKAVFEPFNITIPNGGKTTAP
jgi:hypothetical protein